MRLSKGLKILFVFLGIIVAAVVATPFVARAIVKGKLDAKLKREFGDLATYSSMSVTYSPFGFTVNDLQLGARLPEANGEPIIKIQTYSAVVHSIFDSELHFKNVLFKNCEVNATVDERGESSLAMLVREKPLSVRKTELPIDNLEVENVHFKFFVARQPDGDKSAGASTTSLRVSSIHAKDFIMPVPGHLMTHEQWITAVIEKIEAGDAADKNPAIRLDKIAFQLDQAESTEVPVRLKNFKVENSECITDYAGGGISPAFKRVISNIEAGFGLKESKEIKAVKEDGRLPHGTGVLLEDFLASNATIETRSGQAFWKLSGAKIDSGNVAFGEKLAPKSPGFLKVESATQSSTGPGTMALHVTELSGSWPRSSFRCDYRLENVDALAFSNMPSRSDVRIVRGSLSMSFSGGATDGNLNLTGSVSLSEDFEISSGNVLKKIGARLKRGKTIDNVTIDGTLEHPQIHLPQDLSELGELLGNIIVSGPIGIADSTVGKIPVLGQVVMTPVKETTKVISKVPLIGKLFGGDKDKKKDDE